MIGKLDNIGFLIFIMIFYVNFSSICALSIEQKISLGSPFKNDTVVKYNQNYNNNFILINEKIDNFNKFLDNLETINIYNFFEKSLEAELTKTKKNYFEKNNLDSSVLTQIKSNETKNSNNTQTNNTNNVAETKTVNKANKPAEVIPNPPSRTTTETPEIKKDYSSSKSPGNVQKALKNELEASKHDLDQIKYSNEDLKDKTNSIIDKLKDLDEKQTKLIIELKKNIADVNKESNENIDFVLERTKKIERELEIQKKNAVDIKILYQQAENLSKRIDNADTKSREISDALSGLTDEFRNVKYKIISDKIDSDNKMSAINKKLTQQLKIMYTTQILESQKQAEEIQIKLNEFNTKIKQIKAKLPESNNVCSLLTNCGSCTSNPDCSWCSMSQECVPGSKNGPSNGQCSFFDYGSCGGPRDCGSYNNCGDCLKDISCGWCNSPGNQKCMEKNLAEQGNCSQDKFIHLWKSLNICPHNKFLNKEASFDGSGPSVLESLKEKDNTKIPLIDPTTKKRLIEELKFYLKEVSDNELKLGNILSAVGDLKKELLKLEQNTDVIDDYAGVAKKVEKTEEEINKEFHNITVLLLPVLQDYLKKTKEKESIVNSGDILLKEIKDKKYSKVKEDAESNKNKLNDVNTENKVFQKNIPENNSTILDSGLIRNGSTNSTLGNSSIISNQTFDNIKFDSTESNKTNNSGKNTSNLNEKLDHIPFESNKTINDANHPSITNQTISVISNQTAFTRNTTILASNQTSFIEMKTNKTNDLKTNLRARASIII